MDRIHELTPVLRAVLTSMLLLSCVDVAGQTSAPSTAQETARRSIRIRRITEPIKIDGRLDERAWSEADVANDFRQQEPNEGSPASEETEILLLVDEKHLYIGVRASDSDT